jgi:hypothetical protein
MCAVCLPGVEMLLRWSSHILSISYCDITAGLFSQAAMRGRIKGEPPLLSGEAR